MRTNSLSAWLGLMTLAMITDSQSLELAGRYGYIGEWEIRATLAEDTSISFFSREFSGPLRMRHTAMCMPGEVEEKTGHIRIKKAVGSAKVTAKLKLDGAECSYSGILSETKVSFLKCPGEPQIPLYLWAK